MTAGIALNRGKSCDAIWLQPRVSVVICAYAEKRWDDLCASVESVLGRCWPVDEVIVVVDHNRQLLQRAVARWVPGDGAVRVVPSRGAAGLSGARNTGVSKATGEVVAFIDDDATADPEWIASLVRVFADPHVVCAGGSVLARLDSPLPTWWPAEFNWVVGCSWVGLPEAASPVRNVIGCNMAFRRTDLLRAGGFSDEIGRTAGGAAGCEETDLCIRLCTDAPGARVMYIPDAVVHHRIPRERLTWTYFKRRCYDEGRSKAVVAARNGAGPALTSERHYAVRTLPRGIARGLDDARRGQLAGLARAGAITLGFAITSAGYTWGRIRRIARDPEEDPR